jgi:hypothetical protein
VLVSIPEILPVRVLPEDIPLDIVFEDWWLINRPGWLLIRQWAIIRIHW